MAAQEPELHADVVYPGTFDYHNHFYTKVYNAQIHPIISYFLNMGQDQIISRYLHLNPMVTRADLEEILDYRCRYFRWSGSDLIFVTTSEGQRQSVVIETNSCPSGQKSMPFLNDHEPLHGYKTIIDSAFKSMIERRPLIRGEFAVVYDINYMESSGYAHAMADIFQKPVYLVKYDNLDDDSPVRYNDGVMEIKTTDGTWVQIAACFRFVTQKPWNRFPLSGKTLVLNPIISCLGGGRNKLIAAKAYDLYNAELAEKHLHIRAPETIVDVSKEEVPLWVKRFGGFAVVKVPYDNCGGGIYTITSPEELDAFMAGTDKYEQYIVQSLIGNYRWSSTSEKGKYYHLGTIPSQKGNIYVSDLRFMVCSGRNGFAPIAIYGRRAAKPLADSLTSGEHSWDMLGTNLSYRTPSGELMTDPSRLILMDRKDFNMLGIGLDDIIEAYMQTVLSTIAIDKMCINLMAPKNKFRVKLFKSLNADPTLHNELMH